MSTVKAVVATRAGGPAVLELGTCGDPVPAAHQVLVRVSHAGVNFADVVMRQSGSGGLFPFVPGVEGAGVVVAVGGAVTLVQEGQRVSWAP
jgi:NADPH:quinone reductase